MSAPVLVAVLGVLGLGVFALAWWSSGRSRRQSGGSVSAREIAKGMGTLEGQRREPPGTHGGGVF